jgi:chromosomal replication initiation ATPase DnaA
MKQDVFNQYVDRVSDLFSVSREELFSKSKRRELSDARHLLYYLCAKRPIQISYIQKYMKECGYQIQHSSIIHGIKSIEEKVDKDKDYLSIVKDINKAVFI